MVEYPEGERPKPKYGYLSKKDYDSMGLGSESKAMIIFPPGGPEVFYRGKPSTTTRLHEMFHATYEGEHETPEDLAYEELRAHEFSKPGRETLSYGLVFDVIIDMVDRGYRPAKIMSSISKGLERMGYPLNRKKRSELWQDIKHYYETRK